MGSLVGAQLTAAKALGLSSVEAYVDRMRTQKRCIGCKAWKPRGQFGKDLSRPDGLSFRCVGCRRVKVRKATKGRPSAFKGKKHSAEARAAISASHRNRGPSPKKGVPRTPEERAAIRAGIIAAGIKRGADSPQWRGGKTSQNQADRKLSGEWRRQVFESAGYTCEYCGDSRGGNLEAHHIVPWQVAPNMRFDTINGRCLCKPCHVAFHKCVPRVQDQNIGIATVVNHDTDQWIKDIGADVWVPWRNDLLKSTRSGKMVAGEA